MVGAFGAVKVIEVKNRRLKTESEKSEIGGQKTDDGRSLL